MAQCSKCGGAAEASAKFCPLCGTQLIKQDAPTFGRTSQQNPIVPSSPLASDGPSLPRQISPKMRASGAAIAVALLGLGIFLAKTAGILGASPSGTKTTAVLAPPQTQTARAPILQAPAITKPEMPVLTPPAQTSTPMPEDVIAYLRWVKQHHADLKQVSSALEGVAMQIIPTLSVNGYNQLFGEDENRINVPSQTQATAKLSQVSQQLNLMLSKFNSVRPPDSCAPLASQYQQAVTLHIQITARMATVLEKIMTNPADAAQLLPELTAESGSKNMSQSADASLKGADEQLNAVRARYSDIPSDISAGTFQVDKLDSGLNAGKLLGGTGLGL